MQPVNDSFSNYLKDLFSKTNAVNGMDQEDIIKNIILNSERISMTNRYIENGSYDQAFNEITALTDKYRDGFAAIMLDDLYHEQLTEGCQQFINKLSGYSWEKYYDVYKYVQSMNDGTFERYKNQLNAIETTIIRKESEGFNSSSSSSGTKSESWEDKSWDEMTEAEKKKAQEWADDYIQDQVKENPDAFTGW